MNRLKTFFFYIGTLMITNLLVKIFIFMSNKIFDSIPDLLFVPTRGAALGYIGYLMAAEVALKTSNNYEGTRKIIYIWMMIIGSLCTIFGTIQLFIGIYLGVPLFEFNEQITMLLTPNHWLHNLPLGITALILAFQFKKDKW